MSGRRGIPPAALQTAANVPDGIMLPHLLAAGADGPSSYTPTRPTTPPAIAARCAPTCWHFLDQR